MKITKLLIALTMVFSLITAAFGQGQYKKLLKNQGYFQMKTPRSAFGTGTIIGKLGNLKDEPLSTPEQCFPDLKDFLTLQEIVLLDSHQEKKMGINAGANFVPGGGGVLGSIIGALNFNQVRNLDVNFGKTTGYDWTAVAFEQYLDGRTISKACYRRLIDKNSKIVLSTAKVDSMTYTLNGDVKAGIEVNAKLLEDTLMANGGLNYSNLTRNSFTISSPMFVAYKAVSFKDLGLDQPESSEAPVKLEKGKFNIRTVKIK